MSTRVVHSHLKHLFIALGLTALVWAGCDDGSHVDPVCPTADAGVTDTSSEVHVEEHLHNFLIELETGHAHIFREAALMFWVRDLDNCTDPDDTTTCAGKAGLEAVAFRRHHDASKTSEQALEATKFEDNGDGSYTYFRSFNDLGAHSVGIKFEEDEHVYFGAFPFETSRAGGEKFFCDSDADGTDDVAYQIRWNASKGHIHATGTDITFTLELVRSWNADLNVDQPWMNSLDHLTAGDLTGGLPAVALMRGVGAAATEVSALTPVYKGKGIYEVSFLFEEAFATGFPDGVDAWLKISFVDDKGCTVDSATDEENFLFHVVGGH